MPIKTVCIGNPGVGKSTILNCLLGGKPEFQSGVSFGQGLTTILQVHEAKDGNVYMDTPGLSDVKLREKAAAEIEKALKFGGEFKVFFVVTLEAGRVRPDDKTTMKLVLEAATQIGSNFSIVINKLPSSTLKRLQESEMDRSTLLAAINDGLPSRTLSIYYISRTTQLEDEDNATIALPDDLKSFFKGAPSVVINVEQVKAIEVNNYDKTTELLSKQLQEMMENNKILMKKIEEQEAWIKNMPQQQQQQQQQLPPGINVSLPCCIQ